MTLKLSQISLKNMTGIHPDLVRVIKRYLTLEGVPDIRVTEGLRTLARQRALFAAGSSDTLKSRHLTGHAFDVCGWIAGRPDYSWPLIRRIAAGMKEAARLEGVAIEWGGDWKSFQDGPHWQLPWAKYPA